MASTRTLRDRLGGPWAISWRACAINASLASLIFLSEGLSSPGSPGPGPWTVLILIALIPPVLAVWLIDRTVLRNRRTRPASPVLVIAINGLLGGLFNAGIWLGAVITGFPTASASVSSMVTVVIASMWWGSALTVFLDVRQHTRAQRAALIDAAVEVEKVSLQQREILAAMQAELDREVNAELLPLRRELAHLRDQIGTTRTVGPSPDLESWTQMAERLRGTAQGAVRPLSRRLWQRAEERYPRTPWWRIVTDVPRDQPFRPALLIGIHVVLTMWPAVQLFGLTRGSTLVLLEALTILVITVSFNHVMRRDPRHHTLLFITGIVVLQASVPLRAIARDAWVPGSASLGWQVTQCLVGTALIWLTSGIGAWEDETSQLRERFRSQLDVETIRGLAESRQMAELARASARMLHGSVQSRLTACAMAIDQATQARDTDRLNAALAVAIDALESARETKPAADDVASAVDRIVAPWAGICEVDIDIDERVRNLVNPAERIGLIVEEGLANSVRRGDATRVWLTVHEAAPDEILIQLADDGRGPTAGPPGIGSAIIEQATHGRWSLERTPRGAMLIARCAIAADTSLT